MYLGKLQNYYCSNDRLWNTRTFVLLVLSESWFIFFLKFVSRVTH